MELTDHEKRMLLVAFHKLTSGDSVGFDYALWVGFGDGWRDFRVRLAEQGYLKLSGARAPARATPRSQEFCDSLASMASGDDARAAG